MAKEPYGSNKYQDDKEECGQQRPLAFVVSHGVGPGGGTGAEAGEE